MGLIKVMGSLRFKSRGPACCHAKRYCFCFTLSSGVFLMALLYTVFFIVGLFMLTLICSRNSTANYLLSDTYYLFVLTAIIIPRFVALWCAVYRNSPVPTRIEVGPRWCLAYTYLVTLVLAILSEGIWMMAASSLKSWTVHL